MLVKENGLTLHLQHKNIGEYIMDTTMETISFELPKADLKLFKELAKKWVGLLLTKSRV